MPDPGRPSRRHEAPPPPPDTLVPPPQATKPAQQSVCCGVGDGSPRPHHPCQRKTGSGPQPTASRTGGWGGESAQLRTPHMEAGGAPFRTTSCRPHSAQRQHARACAVGLVTCPQAHGKRAAGPGRTPQGRAVGKGRVPNPGHPTWRPEAPPSGRPWAVPGARKVTSQERAL